MVTIPLGKMSDEKRKYGKYAAYCPFCSTDPKEDYRDAKRGIMEIPLALSGDKMCACAIGIDDCVIRGLYEKVEILSETLASRMSNPFKYASR